MPSAPSALRTERLSLRWFTADDAALMLEIWSDPGFIRYVGDREIRSLEAAEAALRSAIIERYDELGYGPYRVALRSDDTPIGICGLFKRDELRVPDLGFCALPGFRKRGYMEEASRAVLTMAREQLRRQSVTAIVSPENVASIALIEKLGGRAVSWRREDISLIEASCEEPRTALYELLLGVAIGVNSP